MVSDLNLLKEILDKLKQIEIRLEKLEKNQENKDEKNLSNFFLKKWYKIN